MIAKGVIAHSEFEHGQFVSNIFTRPKRDGGFRMILNLSILNKYVTYQHFKMDTFANALTLLSPGDYMASVDLKDAYYTVPIADQDTKYLKFLWQGQLYKFLALPNGLTSGPRLFTKILKPPFSYLRSKGHVLMGYIDDIICINTTKEKTADTVRETSKILTELGFIVHPEKSVFTPQQEITFLGFVINTQSMTVSLPDAKKQEILQDCTNLLSATSITIRQVAGVIGKMVAAFPAVEYGPLHYRNMEIDKTAALKANKGHFDRPMNISGAAITDIQWWIENVQISSKVIFRGTPELTLESDASGSGWGATDGAINIGGRWNDDEIEMAEDNRINYLELLAAFFALKSFCKDKRDIHILLRLDNTTAVAYIQNMGGIKSIECNKLAKSLWNWCIARNIWVTAAHLPGILNTTADRSSRKFQEETEWMLNRKLFRKITKHLGTPNIDLFASRLNTQLQRYISWKPDPGAESVDAFTVDWSTEFFYAFPPFCLIGRCLQKISLDNATGILVVPRWNTQFWYPKLQSMLVQEPLVLHRCKDLLSQPGTGELHPLNNSLDLLVCRLSGSPSMKRNYQRRQQTSF